MNAICNLFIKELHVLCILRHRHNNINQKPKNKNRKKEKSSKMCQTCIAINFELLSLKPFLINISLIQSIDSHERKRSWISNDKHQFILNMNSLPKKQQQQYLMLPKFQFCLLFLSFFLFAFTAAASNSPI